MEESEPIYGLAFIAFQSYINRSIKDFKGDLEDKQKLYKLEHIKSKYSKSTIELIIGLANYSKYKEEGIPHKGTKDILDSFELSYKNIKHLDKSPIFQGLTIMDKDWDLLKIKGIVIEWRELLWTQETELKIEQRKSTITPKIIQ
ncbi:hypothetical protein [Maribacter sp. ACAM166]|uniref:hypothetical protein n=1 Tax=Maribacter sp. ACAM166 TaxID=2508996 RepID=UPI0010FD3E4D|nr:hypothetical protein [Maribacter sp. ACAM166]TLP80345.1 hypothetical protein ES765_07725 [Maribacter sp. ACAM166]